MQINSLCSDVRYWSLKLKVVDLRMLETVFRNTHRLCSMHSKTNFPSSQSNQFHTCIDKQIARRIRGIIDNLHFPHGLISNIVNTYQCIGQECRLSAK